MCGGDEEAGEGGEIIVGIDVEAPARRHDYLADTSQPQSGEERSVLPAQLLGGVNERNDNGHENEEGWHQPTHHELVVLRPQEGVECGEIPLGYGQLTGPGIVL